MPQERYNAAWLEEKRLGIVVKNWGGIVGALSRLLAPGELEAYRERTSRGKEPGGVRNHRSFGGDPPPGTSASVPAKDRVDFHLITIGQVIRWVASLSHEPVHEAFPGLIPLARAEAVWLAMQ